VLPQRTFCTAPSVKRGGAVTAVGVVPALVGTACGPSAAEALADTTGAKALVEGLRHRYSGTAISMATQTNATTTCARRGRSPPPLEPTPNRRTRGSPGTDGNEERDGGPAMAEGLTSIIEQSVDVLPRLRPHQRGGQVERLGHQPLNL
jgi:hypothetical protein